VLPFSNIRRRLFSSLTPSLTSFFPPSLPPCLLQVPNCEKLIELGGLKALFPLYMGRGWGTALKGKRQGEKEALTEQVRGPFLRQPTPRPSLLPSLSSKFSIIHLGLSHQTKIFFFLPPSLAPSLPPS